MRNTLSSISRILPSLRKQVNIKEVRVGKLTFVMAGKAPIVVRFNDDEEFCVLNSTEARKLHEILGEFLDESKAT
jgi:hypothetical protein